MDKSEKNKITVFAREGFRRFYAENHRFLEDSDFKPGKKMYRNMCALNKMMDCFLDTTEDYIVKADVKAIKGWNGPSTYAQQERIITNFGLSDTSWTDRDRSVLLLSEKGKMLRKKYKDYSTETPFFISEEERAFSEQNASQYRLYRVFDVIRTKKPRFFETEGYVGDNFTLISDCYIATRDKSEE